MNEDDTSGGKETIQFDFSEHERATVSEYLKLLPFYEDLASVIARILTECLRKAGIKILSVQHRAKEANSLGRKAVIPAEADPNAPKYVRPLKQITDLAGIRVIAFLPETIERINQLINTEFKVIERFDKGEELIEENRFGYQSVHYLVNINPARERLAEYERFAGAIAEIQVRTILQHAWAEIEHDIQYKSSTSIPVKIRRRFTALAGLLEIADREFQTIQDDDRRLADQATERVNRGDLGGVEITPRALKSFLDKRLGPDGRMADWSYEWTTRMLKALGFQDLKQVETAIEKYNDDQLSNIEFGTRQGQLSRFELMLLAALGERFISRHPHGNQAEWFARVRRPWLSRFEQMGIPISTYEQVSGDDGRV